MPEYRRYSETIEKTVAAVNERHPGSITLFMEDDFDRTLGALRIYDVLLVNPIMDGMNLVSKEGPAVNQRDGVVVLSSGAGSFMELGDDVVAIEDALDVEETSRALERALDMPVDQRRRSAGGLKKKVRSTTGRDWIYAQLDDLEAVQQHGEPKSVL